MRPIYAVKRVGKTSTQNMLSIVDHLLFPFLYEAGNYKKNVILFILHQENEKRVHLAPEKNIWVTKSIVGAKKIYLAKGLAQKKKRPEETLITLH